MADNVYIFWFKTKGISGATTWYVSKGNITKDIGKMIKSIIDVYVGSEIVIKEMDTTEKAFWYNEIQEKGLW